MSLIYMENTLNYLNSKGVEVNIDEKTQDVTHKKGYYVIKDKENVSEESKENTVKDGDEHIEEV